MIATIRSVENESIGSTVPIDHIVFADNAEKMDPLPYPEPDGELPQRRRIVGMVILASNDEELRTERRIEARESFDDNVVAFARA